MKKALTKVLLTAITLVIFAAIIPLSANADTSNNKSEVYKVLTQKLKFNSAAACGIMANIERESGFDPTCVGVDSNGLISGGLCQWNGGRFTNLQNYCHNYGLDYLSIEGQLSYLSWEREQSSYRYIFDYLYSVPNTAEGAYDAAYYWCYYYEIPANAASRGRERGNIARNDYWPVYGAIDLKAPKLSLENKKNPYDLGSSVSFTWSDGGEDVTKYYLYITEKNEKGKYDWSKAMIGRYSPSTTKKTVGAALLDSGDYAACVRAYNSDTGKIINSNFTTFSIKCISHKCTTTILEKPTLSQAGLKLVTCTECGAQAKKTIPILTQETFGQYTPESLKVTGYNDTQIRLNWDKVEGADGYRVYQKIDGKWKAVSTIMDPNITSVIISSLEQGTKHIFTYRAFIFNDAGVFWSGVPNYITAATRPSIPALKDVKLAKGSCTFNWSKVDGVTGYAIYVAENGSTKYKLLGTASADATTFTAKSLKSGTTYSVGMRAYIKTPNGYVYGLPTAAQSFVCP